jgi:2-dehydro-3-deoxygluconokinase
MTDFVTIGETCAVFAATAIGRMRYSKTYEIRPGGAESTVAVGVARLGHSATWVSRLGDDELGQYLLTFIRGEGVEVACSMLSTHPTGLFVRERLPRGKARHFYYRAGSAFSTMGPADIPTDLIAGARVLHLTGITPALSKSTRAMVTEAIRIARQNGVTVLFDPNMRRTLWSAEEARTVMEPLMASADYVLPGLEDLQGMYGENLSEADAVDTMRKIGCRRIIFKRGAAGAAVITPDSYEQVECTAIADPVDLMGAGDAFAAGFAAGLLDGKTDVEAARLGNVVAGMSIGTVGNIESLPTRRDVETHLRGERPVER